MWSLNSGRKTALLKISKVFLASIVCIIAGGLFFIAKTDAYANTFGKDCCRPNGSNTLADFLEIDAEQFVNWLASHENDNYYKGTPYASLPETGGEPHPNGDSKGGVPGMQCNGFVAHALKQVGAKDSKFSAYDTPFSSYVYGTNAWIFAIAANDIQSFAYDTVDQLLNDGKAEKGDIIICSAKDYVCDNGVDKYGNKLDGHIGVFWGNSSSDNVFWHSSHSSNGFEQIPDGNSIGHIVPKADSDFLLVKMRNKGWIDGIKTSKIESITNKNSCYSLEGAVYSIFDDGWNCNNKVGEMKTDVNGYMKSEKLTSKTYYIKETTTPKGYASNDKVYETVVKGGQTTTINVDYGGTVSDVPKTANVSLILKKFDKDRSEYDGKDLSQGSATLNGAKFEVSYFDVEGQGNKTISTGDYESFLNSHSPVRVWKLTSDEKGCCYLDENSEGDELYKNSKGEPCIPLGVVSIREMQAPVGYLNSNEDVVWIRSVTSDGDVENVNTFNPLTGDSLVKDEVIRGGLSIEKRDSESGLLTPLGGASLDGTMFNISLKDSGQKEVKVDEKWFKAGQVVKTLTIRDGKATSGCVLPYGTYIIQEVKIGEGYRLTDGTPREFSIKTQGQVVKFTGDNSFYNEVYRGDFEWVKVENGTNSSYQNPLANVPFVIRSKTTGEEHVVVTDGNGQVKTQSDWNKHSAKTNANDDAVTKNSDGSYSVDEGKLDSTAGVWFGQKSATDKSIVAVQDDEGALPYDNYEIQELSVSSNKGYRLITRSAQVYKDKNKVDLGTITNEVEPYGGIRIFKSSSSPTTMQLKGAEFKIYSDPSMTDEFLFRTVVTDEQGVARTGDTFDVPGNERYWIKETKAPTGYLCDEERVYQAWVVNQQWAQVGNTDDVAVVNTPIYGGIKVEKRDLETDSVEPQGGASIDGTKFEIRNKNDYWVHVDDVLYAPNDVVKTIVVENGFATTQNQCLPYGTYEIQEVEAGVGYNLTDGDARKFKIENDGEIIEQFTGENSFYNDVIRGDVKLVKCFEEDHKRMAGIPFRITNLDTGEAYEITTDVNGEACTEGGLLPYGKYRIEELRVEANKMCKMITLGEISIYQDNITVDLGTLRNTRLPDPTIRTTATDASDGDKTLDAGKVTVADNVQYENLIAGKEYTMNGILHLKSDDGDDEGEVEESKTAVNFTPEEESGTVLVELQIDTEELQGRELVVFEECVNEEGETVATDADITYSGQTVKVAEANEEAETPPLSQTSEQVQAKSKSLPITGDEVFVLVVRVLLVAGFSILLISLRKTYMRK